MKYILNVARFLIEKGPFPDINACSITIPLKCNLLCMSPGNNKRFEMALFFLFLSMWWM